MCSCFFLFPLLLQSRLLLEDSAIPGVSQLARAVMERFAAQITLYPGQDEVAALAETLQIAPALVGSFFKERARMLRSFESQPLEPPFKVPARIKIAPKASLVPKENAVVPKIQVIQNIPLAEAPKVIQEAPRLLHAPLKAPLPVEKNEKVTLPRAKRKPRPPLREITTFTLRVPLPSDIAEPSQTPLPVSEDHNCSLIAAIEADDNPLPLQTDLDDKIEPPAASTPTPWPPTEGAESDESFVRGLLAHPPSDFTDMTPMVMQDPQTPLAMQDPQTPLPLEQFPSSPLKTPVRGLSRNEDDGY